METCNSQIPILRAVYTSGLGIYDLDQYVKICVNQKRMQYVLQNNLIFTAFKVDILFVLICYILLIWAQS